MSRAFTLTKMYVEQLSDPVRILHLCLAYNHEHNLQLCPLLGKQSLLALDIDLDSLCSYLSWILRVKCNPFGVFHGALIFVATYAVTVVSYLFITQYTHINCVHFSPFHQVNDSPIRLKVQAISD
jgi:hypothetical protein